VFVVAIFVPIAGAAPIANFTVVIGSDGTTTLNKTVVPGALRPDIRVDSIILPVVKEITSPRPSISVTAKLPVTMAAEWQPRLRQNRCTCHVTVTRQADRTFLLVAKDVNAGASLSFEAEFTTGILKLPAGARAALGAERLSPWLLGIALAILLTTIIFLGRLMWELAEIRKFKIEPTAIDHPPNDLSPAIISLIPSGKITLHTLAAMLTDLGSRGHLAIKFVNNTWTFVEKDSVDLSGPGFAFGSFPSDQVPETERNKAKKEGVTLAEKYLLAKLFTNQQQTVTERDFKSRLGRHLSSFKIGKLYAELYRQVTEDGYFIRNPHEVHLRYRGLGIGIFFLGLSGFLGSFFLPGDKLFLQLTLVLVMVSGRVVTKMIPYLPLLTVTGQAEWARWAGFRAYLGDDRPFEATVAGDRFFTYLPYALAFNLLESWAKRFGSRLVTAPLWFITEPKKQPVADFVKEVAEVRQSVAAQLAAIHEHTVH
jgi:hypothetical protein